MTRFIAAFALCTGLGMSAAQAWQADNFHEVNPVGDVAFEVIGRAGSAGPDYWCAAGDYALRVLGAASNQRIYLVRKRGAPETSDRSQAVQFSLRAPAGADTTPGLFLRLNRVGDNLSAAVAQTYCLDRKNMEF